MDAAEADFDAKLYKASSDLIPEIQAKLPKLIWHDSKSRTRIRTHVLFGKCEEVSSLVSFTNLPEKNRINSVLVGSFSRMASTARSGSWFTRPKHRRWLSHFHRPMS